MADPTPPFEHGPASDKGSRNRSQKKKGRNKRSRQQNRHNRGTSTAPNEPRPQSRRRLWGLLAVLLLLGGVLWWSGQLGALPRTWAQKEIVHHRFAAATEWLEWAQRLAPRDPRNALLAARIARHQGDLDALTFQLGQAGDWGADEEETALERDLALAQAGELDVVEERLIARLAGPNPDAAAISDSLANGLAAVGRFDEAASVLFAWRDDFSSDPRCDYRLGRIYEHQERYDEAEASYLRTLEKSPQFYPAIFSLGRVMMHQRRVEDALEQYRRCLAMENPAAAKIEMAVAYKSLGRGEEARELLQAVLELGRAAQTESYRRVDENPDGFRAAAEYGRLEADAGNFELAEPWLRAALKDNPLDLTVRYSLGVTLRGLGEIEQAEAQFERVRAARDAMGVANALNERIKRDPADVDARFELGQLVLEHESERIGLYWLRSIFAFDPDYQPAHALLADYYARKLAAEPDLRPLISYHRRRAAELAAPPSQANP
ncbi:tetratricopeptide repeat protein [Planctomycetaceae bacterium SH139]